MPSPHTHTTVDPLANPSTPGAPEWLYNEIMRNIEPDLLTTVMPRHAEMYAKETHQKSVERMKRYDSAFAVFDRVAMEYERDLHEDIQTLKRQAQAKARKRETAESKKSLKKIEKKMKEFPSG